MYDIWLEPPRSHESINVTIRKIPIRFDAMGHLFLKAVNMSEIGGEI